MMRPVWIQELSSEGFIAEPIDGDGWRISGIDVYPGVDDWIIRDQAGTKFTFRNYTGEAQSKALNYLKTNLLPRARLNRALGST